MSRKATFEIGEENPYITESTGFITGGLEAVVSKAGCLTGFSGQVLWENPFILFTSHCLH